MIRRSLVAAAIVALSATAGSWATPPGPPPPPPPPPVPECRTLHYISVNPPFEYYCHCNDGTVCNSIYPHCEMQYGDMCRASAPSTGTATSPGT